MIGSASASSSRSRNVYGCRRTIEGRHRDGEMVRAHARDRVLLARPRAGDCRSRAKDRRRSCGRSRSPCGSARCPRRSRRRSASRRAAFGACVMRSVKRLRFGRSCRESSRGKVHALSARGWRSANAMSPPARAAGASPPRREKSRCRASRRDAGRLAGGEQQCDERARLRIVPDERARSEPQAREVALRAALARRRDLAHDVAVGESARPTAAEAKATLLHRDAARLVQERLPVARAHDERIHRGQHFECAVQPLDASLLRFERAGFQELVDDDAQVTLAEVAQICCGCSAREASTLAPGADLRVLAGFSSDAPCACASAYRRPGRRVGRIEDDRDAGCGGSAFSRRAAR